MPGRKHSGKIPHPQLRRRDARAGVAGADGHVGLARPHELAHHRDRAVRLLPYGIDRRFVHLDDLRWWRRVDNVCVYRSGWAACSSASAITFSSPTQQDQIVAVEKLRSVETALEDFLWGAITTHDIDGCSHASSSSHECWTG